MLFVPSLPPPAFQSLSSVKESDWVTSIEILLETDFLIMWPFYQYSKLGMMLEWVEKKQRYVFVSIKDSIWLH